MITASIAYLWIAGLLATLSTVMLIISILNEFVDKTLIKDSKATFIVLFLFPVVLSVAVTVAAYFGIIPW